MPKNSDYGSVNLKVTQGLIMAFDFGMKWVGVATGQTLTASATPLTTLAAKKGKVDAQALQNLVEEWRPQTLVVGLPLNMDESESVMCDRARAFATKLGNITKLPVEMVDERLSSRAAIERRGMIRTGRPDDPSHAEAACVIAETWLNSANLSDSAQ